jgi:alpha-glucosidase (family GH31 glycosyl hydrolase)
MVMGTYKGLVEKNEDKNTRPFILSRSFFAG